MATPGIGSTNDNLQLLPSTTERAAMEEKEEEAVKLKPKGEGIVHR